MPGDFNLSRISAVDADTYPRGVQCSDNINGLSTLASTVEQEPQWRSTRGNTSMGGGVLTGKERRLMLLAY